MRYNEVGGLLKMASTEVALSTLNLGEESAEYGTKFIHWVLDVEMQLRHYLPVVAEWWVWCSKEAQRPI